MDREKVKRQFETFETRSMHILELADLLRVISEPEMLADTGKFIYLITDILFKECNKLDNETFQLKITCLD